MVGSDPSSRITLDGFPRDPSQAQALLEYAAERGWLLWVLALDFMENHEQSSIARQASRYTESYGRPLECDAMSQIVAKARRLEQREALAIDTLEEAGIVVHRIPVSDQSVDEVSCAAFDRLGLGYDLLNWDRDRLSLVRDGVIECGLDEVYVVSGLFQRPFWDGRFGPPQYSTDVDVVSRLDSEERLIASFLRRKYPAVRWATANIEDSAKKRYGIVITDFLEWRSRNPLRWRQGGVRITPSGFNVLATPAALTDLRAGVLQIDKTLLARLDPNRRDEVVSEGVARAIRSLADYPSLRPDEVLAGRIGLTAQFRGKRPLHPPSRGIMRWKTGRWVYA
jgi:hypothetical protein